MKIDDFREEVCSVCGKTFIPAIKHMYKTGYKSKAGTKYQCGYTCWREETSEKDKKEDINHG